MPTQALIDDVLKIAGPTVTAAALGALFSFLPGRFRKMRRKKKGVDMLKAQVLFCTAGAMMVMIIGADEHSAARAFGLLGLGSFIRFRTVLKSPADMAVFFILIGIGMACGLGRPAAGLFGTLFLMILVTLLDLLKPSAATAEGADAEAKEEDP